MTEAASAIAVLCHDRMDDDDLATVDLHRRNTELRAELDEVEPVISASLLVATAFRLRDQESLAERAPDPGPGDALVRGSSRLRLSRRSPAGTPRLICARGLPTSWRRPIKGRPRIGRLRVDP